MATPKSLALSDGEVVNAAVLADDFAVGGDQLSGGIGQRLALLGQIGVEKVLVVAAGDKADFLRVGLLGQRQPVLRASSRTSGFVIPPSGNSVRLSCSWVSPKRK